LKLFEFNKALILITLLAFSAIANAIKDFEPQQPIRVAVNTSSYPYHFKNDQGKPAGIMVELWRLWAEKQQVEVEFVIFEWSETIAQVRNGTIDIHAGLSLNKARQEFLAYTTPFFSHKGHVFLHRDIEEVNSINQLMPYTVGIVESSSHLNEMSRLYPDINIRIFKTRNELLDAALNDEIFVFGGLNNSYDTYPRKQELLAKFPPYKRLKYYSSQYASATAKGSDKLLAFIEQGLAKISEKEKQAIENKWSKHERRNNVLRLVFTPNFPPYMGVSPEGKPQGLFIDIWRLWSKQTGQKIEFIAEKMSDAIELINKGEADVHIAYPEVELEKTGLIKAREFYPIFSQVYLSNDYKSITSLDQLQQGKLGVFLTAPYKAELINRYPELNIQYFKDFNSMFKAAELKQIDAMIGSVESMRTHLVEYNLQSSFSPLISNVFQAKTFTLIPPRNKNLINKIQDGFSQIPKKKFVELENIWLSNVDNGYFNHLESKVPLTDNERRWLEVNQPIKIGIDPTWKPIEFIDEKGNRQGINPDIASLVAQRTGIEFEYITLNGWNALFQGLMNKEIDILAGASRTAEREEYLLFSQPYWDMPSVIVHPQHLGDKLTLKDFYGKSLAIVKGYYLVSYIQKNHPSILLKLVDSYDEALFAVQRELADGLIENIAISSELVSRENLIKLNISVVDELDDDKHYFAIQMDTPELKSIIDKGVASISDTEKQAIYEKWFGINVEAGYNKTAVMRIAVQVSILIFIIIIAIVIWNRRLRSEIQSRIQLEEKMKHMATHDELTGLANRVLLKDRITTAINFHQRQQLEMAVLFIDLDGFKNINDTYGHDVGDELLIEVANTMSSCVRKSDTVVRFGGDEFVLLLTALNNKSEAAFVAEKVLKLMQQPFKLSAAEALIGCSIGIAMYPNDGDNHIELVKVADTLMYKVKASGKNNYIFNMNSE